MAATRSMKRKSGKCAQWTAECAFDAPAARRICTRPAKGTKRKHERESKQRRSARYTTISAITGRVIRENTVVKKVPRDMVRVSPS